MDSRPQDEEAPVARLDHLGLDLDLRLSEVWNLAWGFAPNFGLTEVALLTRMAYAAGYLHALGERRRGQLCHDHGFTIPRRGTFSF